MPQKSIYRVVHFLMIHENQHTPYNLIQFYFLTQTVSLFLSLSKTCHLGLTVKLFIYHSLLHCLPLVSPSMLPQTSPHTKQSYSLKDLCPTYNNNNSVFTSCRAFNIFFFTIIKSIILLHLRSLFWLTYVYLWMLLWQKKMFATLRFQSTQKKTTIFISLSFLPAHQNYQSHHLSPHWVILWAIWQATNRVIEPPFGSLNTTSLY